jgi:hypothetical protein
MATKTIKEEQDQKSIVCDIQHVGKLPSTWDFAHLIVSSSPCHTHHHHGAPAAAADTVAARSSSPSWPMIYARALEGVTPNLLRWNMATNEVTETISPLLADYFECSTAIIDHHIVFFGTDAHCDDHTLIVGLVGYCSLT